MDDRGEKMNERLNQLGQAARRLNEGSDQLNALISAIDKALGRLMIGMDYVHPRPLQESMSLGRDGKRVIELCFLGYLRVGGEYHLVIKTVKILESKVALASETPGTVIPLLQAPRLLRHQAVDLFPELIQVLSHQVGDLVAQMERRCATAKSLLEQLEGLEAQIAANREAREARPDDDASGE
jgi:hypothetical protein